MSLRIVVKSVHDNRWSAACIPGAVVSCERRCGGWLSLRYSSDAARSGTRPDDGRRRGSLPPGRSDRGRIGWRGPGRRRRVRVAQVLAVGSGCPRQRSEPSDRRSEPTRSSSTARRTSTRWAVIAASARSADPASMAVTISACSRLAASRRWAMRFRVSDWRVSGRCHRGLQVDEDLVAAGAGDGGVERGVQAAPTATDRWSTFIRSTSRRRSSQMLGTCGGTRPARPPGSRHAGAPRTGPRLE